ncbi:MAG: DNA ligase (ATP) [Bacillota bacterium]|nr:MAG: DNA ligase (ATP) [Bacillota bacterium]
MKLMTAGEVPRGNFIYQLKWDGVRMLSFVSVSGVILQNKQLRIRTAQYPELQKLPRLLKARQAVLDGEIVVPTEGLRTSFQSVIRRDFASNPSVIKVMSQTLPIHYIIFDILQLDGQTIATTPLEERLSLLRRYVRPDGENVTLIEDFPDGLALYAATKEMGMEGIVAKEKASAYLSGERTSLWQKIKHRLRETFIVLGYTTRDGLVNSLVLGSAEAEGVYLFKGRAGSGLTSEHIHMLTAELPKLHIASRPQGFPKDGTPVHPHLQVDIEFMEWTEDGVVRAPSIKGFSVRGEQSG